MDARVKIRGRLKQQSTVKFPGKLFGGSYTNRKCKEMKSLKSVKEKKL